MPWGIFGLALLVTYVAQTGLVGALGLHIIDLFLVLALVGGLAAPFYDARLSAWIIGLAQDLGSTGPVGVHAFALGLAVMVLTRLRAGANLRLASVRFLLALLAGLAAQAIVLLHARLMELWQGGAGGGWWPAGQFALLVSIAAAVLVTWLTSHPWLRRMIRDRARLRGVRF